MFSVKFPKKKKKNKNKVNNQKYNNNYNHIPYEYEIITTQTHSQIHAFKVCTRGINYQFQLE